MLFGLLIMLTACHINSDISEPKDPGGFTFQREDTFSCGGTTNTVKIYKHEITGLEFVLLPGNEEIDPFLISRTETTQGVWLSIMGTYEWRFGGGVHAYVQEGEDNPAVFITGANLSLRKMLEK